MENDLIGLPTWYDGHGAYPDQRTHGPVPDRRPRRNAVVRIRSDLLSTMASWCGLVADQRAVTGPNQLDIRQLATFLVIHFTWVTAHPAAASLADRLAELTDAIGAVVLPARERQQPTPSDGIG